MNRWFAPAGGDPTKSPRTSFLPCLKVGEIQKGSVNESAHGLRSNKNWDGIGIAKLFNSHA